jgi:hypothetical protein
MKAMAKSPDDRYATADEFRAICSASTAATRCKPETRPSPT